MQDSVEGVGALAQFLGRTAFPCFENQIVPAAKRIGADLFEIAAPEIEWRSCQWTKKTWKRCWNKNSTKTVGSWKKRNPSVDQEKPFQKVVQKSVAVERHF